MMEQIEADKGWFWRRAIILLGVCLTAVVGLAVFLKGTDIFSDPSRAGLAIGSAIGMWALGGSGRGWGRIEAGWR